MISIEDSSVPFRALLGATLSIVKTVSVEPSEFSPDMELDTIVEEEHEGPFPEDDIHDGSACGMANDPLNARNRDRTGQENELAVCPCLLSPVICLAHLLLGHLVFPKLA